MDDLYLHRCFDAAREEDKTGRQCQYQIHSLFKCRYSFLNEHGLTFFGAMVFIYNREIIQSF